MENDQYNYFFISFARGIFFLNMEIEKKVAGCSFKQTCCIYNICWWFGGLVTKSYPTLATPWTVVCQASLSMGFSRQEYWSGLPFSSPAIFPTQESNPGLLHCRQILYNLSHRGSPINNIQPLLLLAT